jgi:hypothetical protein
MRSGDQHPTVAGNANGSAFVDLLFLSPLNDTYRLVFPKHNRNETFCPEILLIRFWLWLMVLGCLVGRRDALAASGRGKRYWMLRVNCSSATGLQR